jgi:hypothetical protein
MGFRNSANLRDCAVFHFGHVPTMVCFAAHVDASDAFAVMMLGVIGLAMGTVALLFYCMRGAAARRDPHVDALLDEVEKTERESLRLARAENKPSDRAPWEREGDWWKQD